VLAGFHRSYRWVDSLLHPRASLRQQNVRRFLVNLRVSIGKLCLQDIQRVARARAGKVLIATFAAVVEGAVNGILIVVVEPLEQILDRQYYPVICHVIFSGGLGLPQPPSFDTVADRIFQRLRAVFFEGDVQSDVEARCSSFSHGTP
jgi:hypothetical protein